MLESLALLQDWNASSERRASFCSSAAHGQKKSVPFLKSFVFTGLTLLYKIPEPFLFLNGLQNERYFNYYLALQLIWLPLQEHSETWRCLFFSENCLYRLQRNAFIYRRGHTDIPQKAVCAGAERIHSTVHCIQHYQIQHCSSFADLLGELHNFCFSKEGFLGFSIWVLPVVAQLLDLFTRDNMLMLQTGIFWPGIVNFHLGRTVFAYDDDVHFM